MFLDELISEFDRGLRSMTGVSRMSRPLPVPHESAVTDAAPELSPAERAHSAGLMRVNHVGEVCAQALYVAQAASTRNPVLRESFTTAAREEGDHLAWTAERLAELGARPSALNPLWYAGSYALGWLAGRSGEANSLGFVVETERQVEEHLAGHLASLPAEDRRSRAIVEVMLRDEAAHGAKALDDGARPLPAVVGVAMRGAAKVMTTTAYWF